MILPQKYNLSTVSKVSIRPIFSFQNHFFKNNIKNKINYTFGEVILPMDFRTITSSKTITYGGLPMD
jgi:hypothetical protein